MLKHILHWRIICVQVITLPSPLDLFKEWCRSLNVLALLLRVGLGLLQQVQGNFFSAAAMWGGSRGPPAVGPDTAFAGSLCFCCPASRTVSNRLPFHIKKAEAFDRSSSRPWHMFQPASDACWLCLGYCDKNECLVELMIIGPPSALVVFLEK